MVLIQKYANFIANTAYETWEKRRLVQTHNIFFN